MRRTNKSAARTPVDQTLEQTANADVASQLARIAAFSQATGVRKRWMMTRANRSATVGSLFCHIWFEVR